MTGGAVRPSRHTPAVGLRGRLTRLRDFSRAVARVFRERGLRGVWHEVRARTIYRFYRRWRLLVLEQDLATAVETPTPPGVEIRTFAGPDWSPLAGLVGDRKFRRVMQRAAAGRTCIVAWRDGRPIGYTWLSEAIDRAVEIYPLVLPPDAAYEWDLYMTRAERNRGVGAALVSADMRLARERGFRRIWRVIAPENVRSLRATGKTSPGARLVGEIVQIKILRSFHGRFIPADPFRPSAADLSSATDSGSLRIARPESREEGWRR